MIWMTLALAAEPSPALVLVRPIPCTVEVSGRAGLVHTSRPDCPIAPAQLPDWPEVAGSCELHVVLLPWGALGEVTADAACPEALRAYGESWLKASRLLTEGASDRITVRIAPE